MSSEARCEPMPANFMIYGATGYTGKLLGREAADRGATPVLSGRDAEKVRAVAEPLSCEHRAVSLADADGLRARVTTSRGGFVSPTPVPVP